jgi:hypothetical protein
MEENQILTQDPYSLFLFALKAPETRRKYIGHLDTFLEFIDDKFHNTPRSKHRRTEADLKRIQERCRLFVQKACKDNSWALYNVVEFLQFLRDQVDKCGICICIYQFITQFLNNVFCLKQNLSRFLVNGLKCRYVTIPIPV